MRHYTEAELESYRDGNVNFLRRIFFKLHLSNCADCTKTFNEMSKDDLFLKDLKDALKKDDVQDNDHTYKKLCIHFNEEKGSAL